MYKRLFKPVSVRKCYNLLPVVETNKNLVAKSTNLTTVKFLSPYDRILKPTAEEVPCSEHFNAKFRTLDGHWIAVSSEGIQTTSAPNPKLKWLDIEFGTPDSLDKLLWDIDQGIYKWESIEEYKNC